MTTHTHARRGGAHGARDSAGAKTGAGGAAPARAGIVLATLILVATVANLKLSVANVALPSIAKAFDSTQTRLDLIAVGYSLGPAFGTFVGGMLMARFGWQAAFLVFGSCSLLWLWPWLKTPVRRLAQETGADRAPRAMDILRQRALWGAGLGHFAGNYTYYFMLSWLPFYMVRERGYSTEGMAFILSGAFAMNAVGSYAGGWAIDRWIARGGSMNFIYKLSMAIGHGGAIVCMLAIALGNQPVALTAIFMFQLLCGIGSPGVFAIPQIVAGERAAGRWVGIQNLMGNVSGMIGPWLTGAIVESTGHFQYAFFLGAGVATLGTCAWLLILPKIQPIRWNGARSETAIPAAA